MTRRRSNARRILAAGLSAALLAAWPGCSTVPPVPPAPAGTVNAAPVPAARYHDTLDAAATVLRDLGFELDRIDHRMGVLTTRPRPASTIAEPWRSDHRTLRHAVAGTLNSHRRIVTVTLTPEHGDPSADYRLRVAVALEQQQSPTVRVIPRFGEPLSSLRELPEEWSSENLPPAFWQPLGADPALEDLLLRRITAKL